MLAVYIMMKTIKNKNTTWGATEGCEWVRNPSYNEWDEIIIEFYVICNSNKQKASECERGNAITSMRTRLREHKSENTRARMSTRGRELERECEVLKTQCWGRETKYEGERQDLRSQWDSDMRGELILCYVQGSIYIVWKFFKWKADNQ